jgi:hypothetical protein
MQTNFFARPTKAPLGFQQDSRFIGRFELAVNSQITQIVEILPFKTAIHHSIPLTTLYPLDHYRIFIA